jgi:hypothetical protein
LSESGECTRAGHQPMADAELDPVQVSRVKPRLGRPLPGRELRSHLGGVRDVGSKRRSRSQNRRKVLYPRARASQTDELASHETPRLFPCIRRLVKGGPPTSSVLQWTIGLDAYCT